VELTRTPRLTLRHWEEADLAAFFGLYSRDDVMRWLGPHPRRAVATADEARERLDRWIAAGRRRLGMCDEGTTDRWFGLTTRQFRKTAAAADR
jgi:RimJ/RimL family protein N-acetyltransferase